MELDKRIELLEAQNAAILRVLWTLRGEYKGIETRIEKELGEYWNLQMKVKREAKPTEATIKS